MRRPPPSLLASLAFTTLRTVATVATVATIGSMVGCRAPEQTGCLGSLDRACVPPAACGRLSYTCSAGRVNAFVIERADQRPPGATALASAGDLVLENDRITVVIDAVDHTHHLANTGGAILDMAVRGGTDHINHIYTITGILPRDAARYESTTLVQTANGRAVVARGTLDGDARVEVVTTYELRPCDPGLRVRTEIFNHGRTVWASYLADGIFLGDGGMTPFVPYAGGGFRHPPLDLLRLDATFRRFPFLAAQTHAAPHGSFAVVGCDRPMLTGATDATLSAVGLPPFQLLPGDGAAFERMYFLAEGEGIAGAQSLAQQAHAELFGGAVVTVTGSVQSVTGEPIGGDERRASLLFYEPAEGSDPDDPEGITPWSETVPDAQGRYTVTLPAGRRYRVRAHALGRAVGEPIAFELPGASGTGATFDAPVLRVDAPAQVRARVLDAGGGTLLDVAEIVLVPRGATDRERVRGSVYGYFDESLCAPYLGPPSGASPACNRVLVTETTDAFDVPPGEYYVYANAGPEWSLAREAITVTAGARTDVQLSLRRIPGMLPVGALTGDFHVHSARSYDTAFPEDDRVKTFLSAGVSVIAATEHDVAWNFADSIARLGAAGRVTVLPGVETTGNVPFMTVPGSSLPKTIGHFGAWPLRFDPLAQQNGVPEDERLEPGALFDRLDARMEGRGVIQIHHPTSGAKIGRDGGYLRVLGVDPRRALPGRDDGSALGRLYLRPGVRRNIDYDVQEVMTGNDTVLNLQYRQVWFWFMNQGVFRAGAANSDSHALYGNVLGWPRNIVLGDFALDRFDREAFTSAVREGRMVGSNGPVIDAAVVEGGAMRRASGLAAFTPASGATLEIVVRAAPWIPVEEVRIVVNGSVVRTIRGSDIAQPTDPFGIDGVERCRASIPLSELLNGRDGWIVVEAGMALPASQDANAQGREDGLIDLIDGDGDGAIDDTGLIVRGESDPRFHADAIVPGIWPHAFTNPWVIDADGQGFTPPGVR